MKNLRLLFLFGFIALGLTTFAQGELPSVNVKTLEGETKNIQDYGKNDKITVISFWATWCAPCKRELDAIHEVYGVWQEKYNMELIAVSVDNSRTYSRIQGVVETKGWAYEILSDIQQELQKAMSFQDVPYTFIIDKDGKIAYSHSGFNPGDEIMIEDELKKLTSN